MSEPEIPPSHKRIFISSSGSEVKLAALFMNLLNHWGYHAYSYQVDQELGSSDRTFRRILLEELKAADLVLFLVSREFRWSSWCQAEAGATLFYEKKMKVIPVPPVDRIEARETVELFLEFNFYDVHNGFSVQHFAQALNREFRAERNHSPADLFEREINAELVTIRKCYDLIPGKWPLKVWPSIEPKCEESRRSIVEHICNSLRNSERTVATLDLVGVSLKFSLKLVGEALANMATGQPLDPKKTLKIQLVHMSAHSHILQALRDERDVGFIKESFEDGWSETLLQWQTSCDKAGIKLEPPSRFAIDYIPPQLGILVDSEVLFLGQCAFKQEQGAGKYQLLVGECEYFHHTAGPNSTTKRLSPEAGLGRVAIERFKAALDAYSKPHLNTGVVLARDRDEWVGHLKPEITASTAGEIILISETQSMFESQGLILAAIESGCPMVIYLRDPNSTTCLESKSRIENAKAKIKKAWEKNGKKANGRICLYTREPAYRALIIGKKLLGFEPYLSSSGILEPSHSKFVVTNPSLQSEHFDNVRNVVMNGIVESVVATTALDGSPITE